MTTQQYIFSPECSKIYLVMEHIVNGELFDWIIHRGYISERDICRFALQLTSVYSYLHESGIAHLCLQPEHVLINNLDPENPIVFLI